MEWRFVVVQRTSGARPAGGGRSCKIGEMVQAVSESPIKFTIAARYVWIEAVSFFLYFDLQCLKRNQKSLEDQKQTEQKICSAYYLNKWVNLLNFLLESVFSSLELHLLHT